MRLAFTVSNNLSFYLNKSSLRQDKSSPPCISCLTVRLLIDSFGAFCETGWAMKKDKKIGYLIVATSCALMALAAISSRWYPDNGYLLSFLHNSGIYLYQTTDDCSFCNGSMYISVEGLFEGSSIFGGATGKTYNYLYLPLKYISFFLLCVALYGSLLIKGVFSAPSFLKRG